MASPVQKYRRRNVFSSPRAQLRIVSVFAVIAGLYVATNYYVGHRLLRTVSDDIMRLPLTPSVRSDARLILEQHGAELNMQLLLLTFSGVFSLLMGGVVLSHRLAGPIYQLSKYLRGVARGEVPKRLIRFRKHDFFKDLADAFNAFQRSQHILPPEDPSTPGVDPGA